MTEIPELTTTENFSRDVLFPINEIPQNYSPTVEYPGQKEMERLGQEIKKANDLISSINKERNESSMRATETIAILVSLFTFISVEFQIFKSDTSLYSGIAFTLILLGGLVLFLSVFKTVIEKENRTNYLLLVSILFIVFGLFSFKVGEDIKKNENKDNLNEVMASSTKPYLDFKNCILKNITAYQCAKSQK